MDWIQEVACGLAKIGQEYCAYFATNSYATLGSGSGAFTDQLAQQCCSKVSGAVVSGSVGALDGGLNADGGINEPNLPL